VIFDSALTLWVLLALVGFFLSLEGTGTQGEPHEAEDTRAAAWYRALAWLALGLGVLTKGPIAFGLPLMVALPYALWCRRARALADPVSILLFLAILLPWVFAMSREVPGFLEYVVLTETASRLTTPALERTGPFWYFLAILPAAVLPWSLVLAFGWLVRRRSRAVHPGSRPDRRLIFLILWLVVPLVFFSLSQSKRPQYVLPMVPAVGILVGALWKNARGRLPGVRVASIGMALLGVCLLLARHRIADWVPATTDVGEQIPITATVLGGVCLVTGAGAWAWASHRGAVLLALSLPVAAVPFASAGLMAAIGRQRSAEELASAIQTAAGPVAEVVGVAAFPPSLPFYLNRTLLLSTTDGVELTSNYLVGSLDLWRTAPDTPLRDDRWWREAMMHCSRARVFVVRVDDTQTRAFLDGALPLIMVTHKYVAYGPCGTGRLARSRQLRNPIPPRQYEAPTPMDHTRRGAGS
jgi:4-amino-4-deoxy-L-arabinose transferase-like glycosyltransferase